MAEDISATSARPLRREARGIHFWEKDGDPNTDPPVTILQGNTLKAISKMSREPQVRDRFLNALELVRQEDLDYVDVLFAYGAITSQAERSHLQKHWYPKHPKHDPERWWHDAQPIVDRIVKSLQEAFRIARDTGLPVEYYWMIVEHLREEQRKDHVVFSRIYQTEQSILLVKFTPPPPHPTSPPPHPTPPSTSQSTS